jgi:hypothetical protein
MQLMGKQEHYCGEDCKHDSGCAVHNAPAFPVGPCDCGAKKRAGKRRKVKPESVVPQQKYPYSLWVQRLNKVFFPDGQFIQPLSERWRLARRGRLTASMRAEIIYKRNPKSWNLLIDKINAELEPDYYKEEVHGVKALNWGRKYEPIAIANIMLDHGRDVIDPGLIFHREHPWMAATPDGSIRSGGRRISIQIKCPYDAKNHLDMLYSKKVDPTYFYQVQWEAMIDEADDIEFYSYDHRQPLATRLVRIDMPVEQEVVDRLYRNALEFGDLFVSGKKLAIGKTVPEGVILPHGEPDAQS